MKRSVFSSLLEQLGHVTTAAGRALFPLSSPETHSDDYAKVTEEWLIEEVVRLKEKIRRFELIIGYDAMLAAEARIEERRRRNAA